jgi:hypothetical protein
MKTDYRATIRRFVEQEDGEPERIIPLIVDWINQESTADSDFPFKVLEDLGQPVPPSLVDAVHAALVAAKGDPERATAFLHEALDERENPTASEAAWGAFLNTFMDALTHVVEEEVRRYHDQPE